VRERDHVFDAAHQIRIADSARDQQSVVVRGVGLFDRAIDLVRGGDAGVRDDESDFSLQQRPAIPR
jgi:hypothetical protein